MSQTQQRLQSMILRILLAILLVLAWWNPALPVGSEPLDVYMVLDDSLSMPQLQDQVLWSQLQQTFLTLPAGSRFALLRYAGQAVMESPLAEINQDAIHKLFRPKSVSRRLPLDRTGTNTAAAIRQVMNITSGRHRSIIILISDGRDTAGDIRAALREARQAGVPVLGIPIQSTARSAWIETFRLPEHASVGRQFPVTLVVAGTTHQAWTARLLVNGQLYSKTLFRPGAGQRWQQRWWVTPEQAGAMHVEVIVNSPQTDTTPDLRRAALVNVNGAMPVLYVASQATPPSLITLLQQNGTGARFIAADSFPARLDELLRYGAVILDDIAISDLPEQRWQLLETAVRDSGLGLLVLGGEHSFSRGSYRHSRLESLLPVTAEATRQQAPAAILFLVDTSGSMGSASQDADSIELARQAVTGTVRHLAGSDLVGLMTFDARPHERLAIGRYADPRQALEQAWRYSASGGTQLAAALAAASDRLSRTAVKTRLLILLTDGAVGDAALDSVRRKLRQNGIQVIALVTGASANTASLESLSRETGGRLVVVRDKTALPRLMREQVERQRLPVERGDISVEPEQSPPFFTTDNWPAWTAYNVTRARPMAAVYLRSDRQDPLLAFQSSGSGRVIAMPGGLSAWAADWTTWPLRRQFINRMLAWLGIGHNPHVFTHVMRAPGMMRIQADILADDLDWAGNPAGHAIIRDPQGIITRLPLSQEAPGRYTAQFATRLEGRYTTLLSAGNQRSRFDTLYTAAEEFAPKVNARELFPDLQTEALMTLWSPDRQTARQLTDKSAIPGRNLFLLIALLCYLFLLAQERGIAARIYSTIKTEILK